MAEPGRPTRVGAPAEPGSRNNGGWELQITHSDRALAALVNLVVVLADNKFFLGRRLSEWAPGGPSLESSVACAALAQEELGHARALYPLLDEMPFPDAPVPLQRGAEREREYCVSFLAKPLGAWPDVVTALLLIDPALTTVFESLSHSRYDGLRQRAARIPGEEAFHRKYAEGRLRDLTRTPRGVAALEDRVGELLPEMLCWFGPPGEPGLEALKEEGLVGHDNEGLRQSYLADVAPLLQGAGIQVGVHQRDGRWTYPELPWDRWNALQRRIEG